ncbi:MAG: hypothetical protein ACFNUU_09770 [Campylobacter sp.]|nr:MAG TPA: hypothetical protein [Caudoviricetes sp.]
MSVEAFKFYASLFKRGDETDRYLTVGEFIAFVKSFQKGER